MPTLPAWVTRSRPCAVPDRVGPFKVLEKIGSGGAGEVWAAYEEALDRRVALKLVQRRGVADEHETRLLREAQALAKLSHPNVVTVHDADRSEDYVYIAMELVDGGTLKSAFADPAHGPHTRMGWLLQAARGLQAAHDLGLVHRDFKPANALLGTDSRVRVADFGLARLAEPNNRPTPTAGDSNETPDPNAVDSTFSDLTITGAILGTPAYMSPEQRMGGRVGPSSDQFSFCVVAWQALYGVHPLTELNLAQWVAGRESLPSPPSVPGIPSSLSAVLRRGLQPSPEARHASMAPIMRALASATRPRRIRRWAIALAATAVGGAGIAVGMLSDEALRCTEYPLGWAELRHAAAVRALEDGSDAGHTAATLAEVGLREFADSWTAGARFQCERDPDAPASCLEQSRATYEQVLAVLQRDSARGRVPEVLGTLHRECNALDTDDDPAWTRIAQLWPELAVGSAQDVLAESMQVDATLNSRPPEETPRLQTENVRLRGAAQAQLGDAHGAVETLRVAYNIAERTGQDAVAAGVAADLARLTAIDLEQPDRGRVWLESADALGPVPADVNARISFARGLLAAKEGKWRAAADAFERSAELQRDAPSYTDGPAPAWLRQAEALSKLGDTQGALRCVERAIERRLPLYGRSHPKVHAAQALETSLQSL